MTFEELRELADAQDDTDPDAHGPWSRADHLLARNGDAVEQLIAITLKANGAKKVRDPEPYPRPGVPRAKPAISKAAQEHLLYAREHRGAAKPAE